MRPEHLRVSSEKEATLNLSVTAVETLGADTLAHGTLSGANGAGGELIARLPGSAKVAPGDTLPLTVQENMTHLFDAETGKRV